MSPRPSWYSLCADALGCCQLQRLPSISLSSSATANWGKLPALPALSHFAACPCMAMRPLHPAWHLDQSCCINTSSLSAKWGKKIIIILRKIQVEAPQTPISFFFRPKGKMHFKVLHIILSDSSFALKLNEVQWNTTSRKETQMNAENTTQCFPKRWAEKQRAEGEHQRLWLKKGGGTLMRKKAKLN